MNKIEILAPAGNMESFLAALYSGADAVYLGGTLFSARASAGNFQKEELIEAIEQAHLYGKKVYIAVNTLLKEQELAMLPEYILPYYEHGLDAAIVQDMGVLSVLASYFPDLPLHASTQMTLTGSMGGNLLAEYYPVTRLVPARELSLDELRQMRRETELELEVFIHGALCVCYSGQCFASSMFGGRSGNRGRCAQPCRACYQFGADSSYLLSPKDQCTLQLLPDLIDMGINSFKIEGRMKKPEYTAYVTYIYKKYMDRYIHFGRREYEQSLQQFSQEFEDDLRGLKDLYNRGGFTKGYFIKKNGRDMMSEKRPNHEGVLVGMVCGIKSEKGRRQVQVLCQQEIHPQDVLELRSRGIKVYEYTTGMGGQPGQKLWAAVPASLDLQKGMQVYRTRNNQLLSFIKEMLIDRPLKKKLYGCFNAKPGQKMWLKIWAQKDGIFILEEGAVCEKAQKQPADSSIIRHQLEKLGATPFLWEDLQLHITDSPFLPVKEVNELRRRAVSAFWQAYCRQFYRKYENIDNQEFGISIYKKRSLVQNPLKQTPFICAEILTEEQWQAALSVPNVSILYARMEFLGRKKLSDCFGKAAKAGKEAWLSMPRILRAADRGYIEEVLCYFVDKKLCKGILVHNLEELAFVKQVFAKWGKMVPIMADYSLYAVNSRAAISLKELGCTQLMASIEQNGRELKELFQNTPDSNWGMMVYGRYPLMVSAQCIISHAGKQDCIKKHSHISCSDQRDHTIYGMNFCKFCYNILYSGQPCDLRSCPEIYGMPPNLSMFFCSFTDEPGREVKQILSSFSGGLFKITGQRASENGFTGHFYKGII